jgi:hypothetical protein
MATGNRCTDLGSRTMFWLSCFLSEYRWFRRWYGGKWSQWTVLLNLTTNPLWVTGWERPGCGMYWHQREGLVVSNLTADKRSPDAWLIEWNAGRHEKLLANEREAERESLILAEDGWEDVEVIPLFRAAAVETTCDSAPAAAGVSRTEPSANPSEGSGPAAVGAVWCIEAGYEGSFCPFTKRVYMMHIDHPELGRVPTYGGPFDSYTVPTPDEDGHLRCERYDHDVGDWVEGGEPTGLLVIAERHAPETTVQPDEKCGNCGDDYSKHLGERLICPDAAMPDIYRWTAEPTQVKAAGDL